MTAFITRLPAFVGRHWLRLLFAGLALFLLSQKQVNFNFRFGVPEPVPAVVPATPSDAEPPPSSMSTTGEPRAGILQRLNLFGGHELTAFEQLTRQPDATVEAFIRRFQNVAQAEQEKFGIPASITMASALLHSSAGTAEAATAHNNFFALGCGADWPGATGRGSKGCIRAYETAWTSFRDHSLYLTSGTYSPLTQFSNSDYRRWAAGLEELGFNGTEDLANQLVRTVDRYQLFRFD